MQTVQLKAWNRERRSRSYLNGLRREGKLPAVMYGKGAKDQLLTLDKKELEQLLKHQGGASAIIDLKVENAAAPFTVMIRDIQREALGGKVAHVDLYQVNVNEKVRTDLPIHLIGEAVGVKKGGALQFGHRTVEVEGMPRELPPAVDLDITSLEIGEKLTVAELAAPAGITILSDGEQVIVSVLAPRMIAEEDTTNGVAGTEPNQVEGSKTQAE